MKTRLITLFLIFSLYAHASHILGGEITWECLGSGKYQFTLTIYHDCAGTPILPNFVILTSTASTIYCNRMYSQFLPSDCKMPFADSARYPYVGAVEQIVYQSGPVTLTGTPPATGWEFTWRFCCRPNDVTNLMVPDTQDFYFRTVIYPYTPQGSSSALSVNPCYSSSPQYAVKPNHIQCVGAPESYQGYVFDNDQDSLFFEWADPKLSTTQSVIWASGYSHTSPLPGIAQNPGNVNALLNGQTGEVTFTSQIIGSFVTCIKTSEYRGGQLIGEIYRDMMIYLKPCTPDSGQCNSSSRDFSDVELTWNQPQDSLTRTQNMNGGAVEIWERHATALSGDTVSFILNATDFDLLPDCSPEQILISAFGRYMSQDSAYISNHDCQGGYPCATLKSLNPNGLFSDTIANNIAFSWYVSPSVVYPFRQEFVFNVDNNTCPTITSKQVIVRMLVHNSVGIQELPHGISFYPQPFTDHVIFNGLENIEQAHVEIWDVLGRLLHNEVASTSRGKINIGTGHLQQGVYVFRLYWADKSIAVKLIKHE